MLKQRKLTSGHFPSYSVLCSYGHNTENLTSQYDNVYNLPTQYRIPMPSPKYQAPQPSVNLTVTICFGGRFLWLQSILLSGSKWKISLMVGQKYSIQEQFLQGLLFTLSPPIPIESYNVSRVTQVNAIQHKMYASFPPPAYNGFTHFKL